jgi:hypothetical protein
MRPVCRTSAHRFALDLGLRYTRAVDFETLYNMAANAARNAERMCSQPGGSGSGLPFQNYAGYPHYIDEYNLLLALTSQDDRR